ncbi:MAG: cation-efflux pump [Candidatus Saliniplasma sp.]
MVTKYGKGKIVATSSILLNIVIFLVKVFIGLSVGSLALLSDSMHSLSDSASSIAVLLGLYIAEKPADDEHPFGHGRADQIAVLSVGIILVLAAVTFLSDGIQSLLIGPEPIIMGRTFYFYIFLTAVAKEVIGEISYFVGKKTGSDPLKADAWHHRGDAITTILVIGAIYGSERGLLFLDPLAGIGIALLLGYIGGFYIKKGANKLLGEKPSREFFDKIENISLKHPGVTDIHNINVHEYGDKKAISLHMHSEPGTTMKGHEIAHELEIKLEKEFNADVEVHFDPWKLPVKKIKNEILELVKKRKDVKNTHHIDISETGKSILISFHLIVPKHTEVGDAHEKVTEIEEDIKDILKNELPGDVKIQIHIEPCEEDCEYCEIEEGY